MQKQIIQPLKFFINNQPQVYKILGVQNRIIKQLHNNNIQQFGRQLKVKVPGFKSKLAAQKQSLENEDLESEQNSELHNSQKQSSEDNIDFRDIELSEQNNEENMLSTEVDKEDEPFTKDQLKFIRDSLLYKGDDPYPDKLVHRPEKGVVWGLGGELMKKKISFFTPGKWPEPEEVIAFLEMEQAKDIELIDSEEDLGRTDIAKYIICLSSYSCVHNYKIAKNLQLAVKNLNVPYQTRKLEIAGGRDDEWIMFDFGNIAVHCFVEEAREEIGMEYRLWNPPSEDDVEEYLKIASNKKKQSIFEPLREH